MTIILWLLFGILMGLKLAIIISDFIWIEGEKKMKICRIKIGMNGNIYRFIGDYHFEKNALIIEEKDSTITYFNFEDIDYFVINGCTNKESEVI